ncbi:MAG: multidrug efflux SMR transporter [Negativicutes bacterium]|nr:multidrug efflux SMR transporter [Negativicutes bacterium]MDR3673196.1 multidrug efflux SMR transporter [Holophaga sp.]
MSQSWILLTIAVLIEIVWALSLKYIQQHPNPWLITGSCLLAAINMALLSFAMRTIPAGTAYAVWTGLGAVGVTIGGIFLFGEPAAITRLFFLGLVMVGVVGLKLVS